MKDLIWVEKYRPEKVADIVLDEQTKSIFQGYVDSGHVPNLFLYGPPGTGKTTSAIAMLKEIGADYYMINASLDRSIDILRNEIAQYASSVSFGGGRKFIIMDEADNLRMDVQQALRGFMETFNSHCGFILTANYPNKVIEALRESRCVPIRFNPSEKIAAKFFKRVISILKNEGITFDKEVVGQLVLKRFPDQRRILNELQAYSKNGEIDTGILTDTLDEEFSKLIEFMKAKKYTDARKWIAENKSIQTADLYRKFYDTASKLVTQESIPELILILARYQYQAAFVADHELNNAACFAEIMGVCDFK